MNGTFSPMITFASSLSSVVTLGVDKILACASFSSAWAKKPKFKKLFPNIVDTPFATPSTKPAPVKALGSAAAA